MGNSNVYKFKNISSFSDYLKFPIIILNLQKNVHVKVQRKNNILI